MALTIEDILARRTRLLLLNAVVAVKAASVVADLTMYELKQTKTENNSKFISTHKNHTLI
jgi:glycerol-3-phosphate dehydrogenase